MRTQYVLFVSGSRLTLCLWEASLYSCDRVAALELFNEESLDTHCAPACSGRAIDSMESSLFRHHFPEAEYMLIVGEAEASFSFQSPNQVPGRVTGNASDHAIALLVA